MDNKNKDLIISRAHNMLMSIGPTSMTMDSVARSCGISKRTLYEIFPDKKTLVLECLRREQELHNQKACQIYNDAENVFEAMFTIFKTLRQYLDKRAHEFIEDVRRLYPEFNEHNRISEKTFITQLSKVLADAQKEGLVIPKINTEIASFLFISQMRSLHNNASIEALGFDPVVVFDAAFINFMHGIATTKGIEYIDKEIENYLM